MTIDEYTNEIINTIKEKGIDCDLKATKVHKTNDTEFTGIMFLTENNINPTVYVDPVYDQNKPIDSVADFFIETYKNNKAAPKGINVNDLNDYNNVKDRIIGRVFNKELNKEMMAVKPYADFGDLIVCFYILYSDDDSYASIQISNEMEKRWNVSLAEIIERAYINTRRLLPLEIMPLNNLLKEMLSGMKPGEAEEFPLLPEDSEDSNFKLYIAKNSAGIYGAFYMTDRKALLEISKKMNCNRFRIIPSSVHEILIINDGINNDDLNNMISEINCTQLQSMEILSDHFYVFDANNEKLMTSDGVVIPFLY